MKNFENKKSSLFLATIPTASIENDTDNLSLRSKFNFSYFDTQGAGQDFVDWEHDGLVKLLCKLKAFSTNSLQHWRNDGILAIYGDFPVKSDFVHPKHVPHQALWGRFRLESAVRLVGFMLPESCNGKFHKVTGKPFDCNTFYVVFLDRDHRFYITEKK